MLEKNQITATTGASTMARQTRAAAAGRTLESGGLIGRAGGGGTFGLGHARGAASNC
jgi:hypothetical protein